MGASTMEDRLRDTGRGRGYLPVESSGVPWMFDPEDPTLQHHADHQAEGPGAPADHRHYIDDAAGCAGTLGTELGTALGDAHLHVRHGAQHRTAKTSLGEDAGAAWETATIDGIRTVRIRTLDGSDDVDTVLLAGVARSAEDFAHQYIVVDLRGNGGGDDSYITDWFSPFIAEPAGPAWTELGMTLSSSGSSTAFWNYATWLRLNHHRVPESFEAEHLRPKQNDSIEIRRGPEQTASFLTGSVQSGSTSGGSEPWAGSMIIVIDGGTGSSAESAALLLRNLVGAVIVGSPSYGAIDYGNLAPYFLPTSGMEIHLPAQENDWGTSIDFVGIRPDIPLPAVRPLREIAADFHTLHDAGAATRRRRVV
ncbi:S41 family peptidase [Arthrobacter echini]|nr:S41 family peptidase [Arthrobacter echini]